MNLNNALDWLNEVPPAVLLLLCLVAMGYIMKLVEWVPNKIIPLCLILAGGVLYPLMEKAQIKTVLTGIIIAFIAWLFHNQVLKYFEKKFGFMQADDQGPHVPPGSP